MYRRNQQVWAIQVLVLHAVSFWIVLKVQHQSALNRIAFFRRFCRQRAQVWRQVAVNTGHASKMRQGARILVELEVFVWAVTFVSTHHRCKGRHFYPTIEQLFGATITKQ